MSGGRAYWYATQSVPEGQGDPPQGRKRGLLDLFRGWHAPIEALIEATDESVILRNDVYDRPPLPRWSVGRATLLGDSAHPMTPDMGQGACQAIEDAVILADCLRDTTDIPAALRQYESRRIPRTRRVVNESRQAGPDRPVVEPARLPIPRGPAQVALRGPQAGRATGLDDRSPGLTGLHPRVLTHAMARLSTSANPRGVRGTDDQDIRITRPMFNMGSAASLNRSRSRRGSTRPANRPPPDEGCTRSPPAVPLFSECVPGKRGPSLVRMMTG